MDDPEGNIKFEDVKLTTGILEKDYHTPWAGDFKAGDRCLLITGKITNKSGTRYWVNQIGYGYDKAGNRVSGTLDAGPLVGIAQIAIEPYSSENFTLHLGWADNVTSLKVSSQKSAKMFP